MIFAFFTIFVELYPTALEARHACRNWAYSGGNISSIELHIRRLNGNSVSAEKIIGSFKGNPRSCFLQESTKSFLGLYREKYDSEKLIIYKRFKYR